MQSISQEARKVLAHEGKPLHYRIISELILKHRLLQTKTPDESVRSILSLNKAFDCYGNGLYGLKEWGFKWYKVYYEKKYYSSVTDLCYELVRDARTIPKQELIELMERRYSSRYKKNLRQLVSIGLDDYRFVIDGDMVTLRIFNKDMFKPINIEKLVIEVKGVLEENKRPLNIKDIIKKTKCIGNNKFTAKEIMTLLPNIDDQIIKLGPKGYYGLREWIR